MLKTEVRFSTYLMTRRSFQTSQLTIHYNWDILYHHTQLSIVRTPCVMKWLAWLLHAWLIVSLIPWVASNSKAFELVLYVSPLRKQHYGVNAKTGRLGVRITFPSGVDNSFSDLALWISCWSSTKLISSSSQANVACSRHEITETLFM